MHCISPLGTPRLSLRRTKFRRFRKPCRHAVGPSGCRIWGLMTQSSGQAGGNPALQRGPDLMLANAVCCRSPNSGSRCVSMSKAPRVHQLLGGMAASASSGFAQAPSRRALIAYLAGGSKAATERYRSRFPQGMRELGYLEGRDYVFEDRYARRRSRSAAVACRRAGGTKPGRDLAGCHGSRGRGEKTDRYYPDRVGSSLRPNRLWHGGEPRATRRQRHRSA